MPLFSIITPAYNSERYIRRCVDSVLKQTFSDWEMIIIDDGSTDDTPAIVDEYARNDKRIRVFHQENRGWCVATNKALENSYGEYLFSLDSDNWFSEGDVLQGIADAIGTYEKPDIVQISMLVLPENERPSVRVVPKFCKPIFLESYSDIDSKIHNGDIWPWSHCGKAINRMLVTDLSMEGNPTGADSRWVSVVLARAMSMCLITEVFLCVEQRSNSLSHVQQYTDAFQLAWMEEEIKLLPKYRDVLSLQKKRAFPLFEIWMDRYRSLLFKSLNRDEKARLHRVGRALFGAKNILWRGFSNRQRLACFLSCLLPRIYIGLHRVARK